MREDLWDTLWSTRSYESEIAQFLCKKTLLQEYERIQRDCLRTGSHTALDRQP